MATPHPYMLQRRLYSVHFFQWSHHYNPKKGFPMSKMTDPEYLLGQQYHNAEKLNTRIRMHSEFSTNPYGWCRWVFDHYDLSDQARILELGAGPGDLWLENQDRIPPSWNITLSDLSPGMVAQAQENLAKQSHPFKFDIIDAQSIPYNSKEFDAIIANHCLFHVPDRAKALSEIGRVLTSKGYLFATTIGDSHMQEIPELLTKFDPGIEDIFHDPVRSFTLTSGLGELQTLFASVEIHRYPDELHITETKALVDYVMSTISVSLAESQRADFSDFIKSEMKSQGGVIRIKKDSGIFVARNPIQPY